MTTVDFLSDRREPKTTREARTTYWTRHHDVKALENRIARTNHGLDWLRRVKRIGRR